MPGRRVAAELRRQLLRQSTGRLVTAFVLLVGAFGLLAAATGDGLEAPTTVPYLFAPALVCPLAAHRVLRDREGGMADVLATSPLTRGEELLAKTLAVLALTPLAVVASLPVLYAVSLHAAPGAFVDLLDRALWALSIGTTAASVGLLLGHSTPQRPRLGLGLAFGTVLVWFFLATVFGNTPNPPLVMSLLRRLSPVSYAVHAVVSGPLLLGGGLLAALPLTLGAWALALAAPLALGLQHAADWHRPPPTGALLLVAAVWLVGAAALVPWSAPEFAPEKATYEAEGYHGEVWGSLETSRFGAPDAQWGPTTKRYPQLTLVGPPNASLEIDEIALHSAQIDFEDPTHVPDRVDLDEIVEDHRRRWNETGGPAGTATINLTVEAHPRGLFNRAPTEVLVSIDGQEEVYSIDYVGDVWRVEPTPILAATAAAVLPLLVATRWLPRRWNRW